MDHKGYTMQELANIIGVNKSTIFRYLKKESIAPATTNRNTNYYSATVLQHLKQHFQDHSQKETKHDQLIAIQQQQIRQLQQELDDEKTRADEQLHEKDDQIKHLHQLLDQSQQLILNAQEENKKLLPTAVDKHDIQEGKYKEQVNQSMDEDNKDSNKKSMWQKLFG